MQRLLTICLLLLAAVCAGAQTLTTVSGTVTDANGQVWYGATVNASIVNPRGGNITFKSNGNTVPGAMLQNTVATAANGSFSFTLLDVNTLAPAGIQWSFNLCSLTSASCVTLGPYTITGSTQSLTSQFTGVAAPSFSAGPNAYGYADNEIHPVPQPGAVYYNVGSNIQRIWSGTAWSNNAGGGGASAAPPAFSLQFANSTATALNGSALLSFQGGNTLTLAAGSNISRSGASEDHVNYVYDVMNTAYAGGWAAALSDTTGAQEAAVINAASNFGMCLVQSGLVTNATFTVKLPTYGGSVPATGVKVWGGEELSGYSSSNAVHLQSSANAPIITGHAYNDTVTCSNGNTYTPGFPYNTWIHNIYIQGAGGNSSDSGIVANGQNWTISDIYGYGQAFGGSAIIDEGFNDRTYNLGPYYGQLSGCKNSVMPGATGGSCYVLLSASIDSDNAAWYASDGSQIATSAHTTGPCYPTCGAIGLFGDESVNHDMFGQISVVGITVNGAAQKDTNFRSDGSSAQGIMLVYAGFNGATSNGALKSVFTNMIVNGACTDQSFATGYNNNTGTGCAGFHALGGSQGNAINNVIVSNVSTFGQSYYQCMIGDDTNGGSATPNRYSDIGGFNPNASNLAVNGQLFCSPSGSGLGGDYASAVITYGTGQKIFTGGLSVISVSGADIVDVQSGNLQSMAYGTPGQRVTLLGDGGSVGGSGANITTCSGTQHTIPAGTMMSVVNVGTVRSNIWAPDCPS